MLKINSLSYEVAGNHLFNKLNGNFNNKKYGLVGPNGVGKTTLAWLISGALKPDSGQIILDKNVSYLSQIEDRPDCKLSAYFINLWDQITDYSQLIAQLTQDIDLNKSLPNLSGGEWMRIRIAKALSEGFDFLILDEPTNKLGFDGKQILHTFIQNYKGSLIVISHDRELLNQLDEIVELSNQGLSFYGGNYSFYCRV